MRLAEYLATQNLTAAAFAEKVAVDQSTICKYLSGRLTPGLEIAGRILVASGGAVEFHDHLDPKLARKIKAARQ